MTSVIERDWYTWHHDYDEPGTALARRLAAVQDQIRTALDAALTDHYAGMVPAYLVLACGVKDGPKPLRDPGPAGARGPHVHLHRPSPAYRSRSPTAFKRLSSRTDRARASRTALA